MANRRWCCEVTARRFATSTDAVPRIFHGLAAYLHSAKRCRARPPTKCSWELSAELETVEAASTLCMSPFSIAAMIKDAINEGEHTGRLFLVACEKVMQKLDE